MPQLAVQLTMPPGTPGLMFDNERFNADVIQVRAGAVIPPGSVCAIYVVSGAKLLFPLKDATTGGSFLPSIVGIALYDAVAAEQAYTPYAVPNAGVGSTWSGYPVGFAVPVLTRGRIWALWDGNTGVALPTTGIGALQVVHSSTGANPQGVVTTKAASATVGFEIDALPATFSYYDLRDGSAGNGAGTYTDPWGQTRSIIPMSVNLPGHI